jgi:dolichyl-phosphate-mannose--protein O-mannosyl transferase
MALGVVAVLRRLPARARRPVAIGMGATSVALFGFFAPVLLGVPVGQRWLDATRWLPHWG